MTVEPDENGVPRKAFHRHVRCPACGHQEKVAVDHPTNDCR
jgi:hypothetical protein